MGRPRRVPDAVHRLLPEVRARHPRVSLRALSAGLRADARVPHPTLGMEGSQGPVDGDCRKCAEEGGAEAVLCHAGSGGGANAKATAILRDGDRNVLRLGEGAHEASLEPLHVKGLNGALDLEGCRNHRLECRAG